MRETCHRCGEELPAGGGETPFCPHCGTPQLTLSLERQSPETGGEEAVILDDSSSTGALPPPLPQQIDWRLAIQCAIVVSAIGSLLRLASLRVEALSPLSFLWMMLGSLLTLLLYQRRRPAAWMDAHVGTRIGLLTGLCLATGTAIALAAWGVAQRFGFHAMGSFDGMISAQIADGMTRSQQMLNAPLDPQMVAFEKSTEFHAGFLLASGAVGGIMLLAISAAGGAFAGLLRMRRGRIA
jgi:hypothetical protein